MSRIHIIQHGRKVATAGDPGLTEEGHRQAALAAAELAGRGVTALFTGPLLRARQTIAPLAEATGLPVTVDDRLTERHNWDGSVPFEQFLADWRRATDDRDHVPHGGESSRATAARFAAFLAEHRAGDAVIALASHGGATVDLLRDLLGEEVPRSLLSHGVPPGAITTIVDGEVVAVAVTDHL